MNCDEGDEYTDQEEDQHHVLHKAKILKKVQNLKMKKLFKNHVQFL